MATKLARKEIVLRSGAAAGADSAFESGCDFANGPKEIYLPWEGCHGRTMEECGIYELTSFSPGVRNRAEKIAAEIHPAWGNCGVQARAMHARNICQVLGADLLTPTMFVICWTPDGKATGGTRTAIILARSYKIPVFNLGSHDWTLEKIVRRVLKRRCPHCLQYLACYCCPECGQLVTEHDPDCEYA